MISLSLVNKCCKTLTPFSFGFSWDPPANLHRYRHAVHHFGIRNPWISIAVLVYWMVLDMFGFLFLRESLAKCQEGQSMARCPDLSRSHAFPDHPSEHLQWLGTRRRQGKPGRNVAVCQNLVPLVNIKIAGKWMFIPLKMVWIGIDPYPCQWRDLKRWFWFNQFDSGKCSFMRIWQVNICPWNFETCERDSPICEEDQGFVHPQFFCDR